MNKARNYRATFILDNRGKEDTTDAIVETVRRKSPPSPAR